MYAVLPRLATHDLTAHKTRVYFTVDVECAEARIRAGSRVPALDFDLRVWGRFANRRRELGIGLFMSELEACGFRGTFFTEVLASHHFGRKALAEVVEAMVRRGHDVQLHLHPVLRDPEAAVPVEDNIGAYSVDEQVALLTEGLELLAAAGAPRQQLRAFRAGNFGANNDTWRAMARVGLSLSSSYNPSYVDEDCMIRPQAPSADLFASGVEGIWELPIANFVQPDGGLRHLQLCAVSSAEMIDSLEQCAALGIGHVAILSHSFELSVVDSVARRRGHADYVTLQRLRALLRFLDANRDRFVVDTVGDLAARLPEMATPAVATEHPRGSQASYLRRLAGQGLRRIAARVRLP